MAKMMREEAWALAQRLRSTLKLQNAISFADLPIKAPDIDYYQDERSFMDPNKNEIHIGVYGLVDYFDVETDAEYKNSSDYMQGHEEQHKRSTADRPYGLGIKRGMEVVLEYIAKEIGYKSRFRNDEDYEYFGRELLTKHGIFVDYHVIMNISAGIMNSLEDGRIERIRSNRFPGFADLRMYHRALYWEKSRESFQEWEKIKDNDGEILRIITNQILFLSTCQIYEKGFVLAYAGTPLMDMVNDLIPNITKAYIAGKTRDMAEQGVEIMKKLAPYIYRVARRKEAESFFRQLMQMIAQAMMDERAGNSGISEKEEDTDDGSLNTAMPNTVLVVDQETYEKLKENTNEKGQIKCISDQAEKTDENEKEGKGSGEKAEGKHDSDTSESGDSGDGQKMPEKPQDAETGESSGKGDKDAEEEFEKDEKEPTQADPNRAGGKTFDSQKEAGADFEQFGDSADDAGASSFDDAIREAKERAEEKAKEALGNMTEQGARERKSVRKETPDKDEPVEAEKLGLPKDIDFEEETNQFPYTESLPPVIREKGRSLFRSNQRYFKSLSSPTITHRDSGSVDPSRIFGLAMGDTDIFRKKGVDKVFDGCAYVLIDNSGSMGFENKREYACTAAAIIEEGFRGLIPIKIAAFCYIGSTVHTRIKGWEEQRNKNCSWNFYVHQFAHGGNADGIDIQVAHQELLRRPESKKLLVILSDGMPTGVSKSYTKGAIQAARRSGITVTGIYFGDADESRGFEEMYEKNYIICEPDDIVANLAKTFKKFSRT